jgi:hypothetical protein
MALLEGRIVELCVDWHATPEYKVFKRQLPLYESTARAGENQVPAVL